MIIYDLKCEKGHAFEGWFKDQQAWTLQNSQKLISCPICNSSNIKIAPTSLTIMGKDSRATGKFQEKEISVYRQIRFLVRHCILSMEFLIHKQF